MSLTYYLFVVNHAVQGIRITYYRAGYLCPPLVDMVDEMKVTLACTGSTVVARLQRAPPDKKSVLLAIERCLHARIQSGLSIAVMACPMKMSVENGKCGQSKSTARNILIWDFTSAAQFFDRRADFLLCSQRCVTTVIGLTRCLKLVPKKSTALPACPRISRAAMRRKSGRCLRPAEPTIQAPYWKSI